MKNPGNVMTSQAAGHVKGRSAFIELRGLSFAYEPSKPVLHDVSFTAWQGEIVNILGPNGCGKSTLLRAILGFLPVARGRIFIDGCDIRGISKQQLARFLAYVPQNHHGAFQYSAFDVVLMGRTAAGPWYRMSGEDYEAARAAMEKTMTLAHADKSYLQLSGGERQLVLIARALAQGADFCIMDEPVTGLDYGNQFRLLDTIRDLAAGGLSFILTTHHPEHAIFLGGRALLFKEGRLIADGTPENVITSSCICGLYNMPRSLLRRVAGIYEGTSWNG